jgi:Toprim-like
MSQRSRFARRPVLSLADLERFDPSAPERGREQHFCCPLPGCADKRRDARHRSFSVSVETGRWHCHRCGSGGVLRENWPHREPRYSARRASSRRAFALTQLREFDAVEVLSRHTGMSPTRQDRGRELFQGASRVGDDPATAYLASRGIARDSAQRLMCGTSRRGLTGREHSGEWMLDGTSRRVVFPVHDRPGQLVAIQGRVIGPDEPGPKVLTRGDLGAGVFRTGAAALAGPPIAVVEAPIDALSLATAGVPAVALCGTNVPEWLPTAVAFRKIALGFDADPAGDSASMKAAIEFRAIGCQVERWRPGRKDWNEVLMASGLETLAKALQAELI